ncbi:MAG: amidohydrolase family protein [Proteobacteria bacterium]|jgi:predicted amidohydrolase YtcJ|nr:amidohydrolase family protein [Pseudomonadota bacterium]
MNKQFLNLRSFWVALLLVPAMGFAQTLDQMPDQIFYNGKVLTVDENFSITSAIAIQGERIVAVGDTAQIRALAGADTEQTDLEGRTVIPGFIDNHLHYLRGTNFAAYELRIHGVTSRKEVLSRITARAEELGPGKWIFILGAWNEQQFADKPGGFTGEELDTAAPNNPVFIQKTYSSFYMNSLAVAEIAPKLPEYYKGGSAIHVDNRSGRAVMAEALKHFPFAETLEERMEEVTAFNDYLNSMGVTTAYDVGYLDGSYDPVTALYESGDLTLRVFYAARYWADSPRTAIAAAELLDREESFQRDDRFGMFGIGEHVHGLVHDSTATDVPISDDLYNDWTVIARSAARNGWYINEHTMRDSTANRMMSIGEEISEDYPVRDLRWTLGHVDLIEKETVDRARELGWNITLANHTVKPRIEGRASPPVRMIQDSGILWGLGSDGTIVATYNPFHTIWEYTAGKVFPDIVKYEGNEVITREQALIAHTRSNAYILFMEDDIGSLEVGKYADFVVLDRDFMSVPINEIRDVQPVMTMLSGQVVFDSR